MTESDGDRGLVLLGGETAAVEWVSLLLRRGGFHVASVVPVAPAGEGGVAVASPWGDGPSGRHASLADAVTATGARAVLLDADDHVRWSDPLATVSDGPGGALPCPAVLLSAFGVGPDSPRGSDLAVAAASGVMHLTGASGDPICPPEMLCEHQTETIAGSHAAMAIVSACLAPKPGMVIEIKKQDSFTLCAGPDLTKWTYQGSGATRQGRPVFQPSEVMRCADGDVFILCVNQGQWGRFVEAMGDPEWAGWEIFATRESRGGAWDILEPRISDFLATKTRAEVMQLAIDYRLAFALGNRPQQVAELAEELTGSTAVSDWLYRVTSGPEIARGPEIPDRPPAPSGTAGRPLEGVVILDLATVWATPHCAGLLASQGARVIKVETRQKLDHTRDRLGEVSEVDEGLEPYDTKGSFRETNQGKESVTLNLATEDGQRLVRELAAHADIVLSNFTPGVERRLHLSEDELWEVNPRLVIGRLSAYPPGSRLGSLTGYGYAMLLMNGFGYNGEGQPWIDRSVAYPDPLAGGVLAFALMRALQERAATGRGALIEIDLFTPSAALHRYFDPAKRDPARGFDLPRPAFAGVAPTRNDEWITVTCLDEADIGRLVETVVPSGGGDAGIACWSRGPDEFRSWLWERTAPWDAQELEQQLRSRGVIAQRVLDLAQVAREAGNVESGFLRIPEGEVHLQCASPWVVDGERLDVGRRAPRLGEHTERVLSEFLGIEGAELAELRDRQVVW